MRHPDFYTSSKSSAWENRWLREGFQRARTRTRGKILGLKEVSRVTEESRLASEKHLHPALTHSWAPTCHRNPTLDHLTSDEGPNVQGRGPPRPPKPITRTAGSSTRPRSSAEGQGRGATEAPPAARGRPGGATGGGRSVNTALVDSLAGNAHPSAAWRPQPHSSALSPPPRGRPRLAPAAPELRAQKPLPEGPRAGSRPDAEGTPSRGPGPGAARSRSGPARAPGEAGSERGGEGSAAPGPVSSPPAPGARPRR